MNNAPQLGQFWQFELNGVPLLPRFKSSIISTNIQLTHPSSQHQQLEARLTLRDWLRGKVPDDQIPALLE